MKYLVLLSFITLPFFSLTTANPTPELLSSCPISESFDFPVGAPNAKNYYNAQNLAKIITLVMIGTAGAEEIPILATLYMPSVMVSSHSQQILKVAGEISSAFTITMGLHKNPLR